MLASSVTMGCAAGPIMIAAGLGLIEDCPAALIKANGGTGADKGQWGADFLGTTRANVLILCGVCKTATILDVWFAHVVPQRRFSSFSHLSHSRTAPFVRFLETSFSIAILLGVGFLHDMYM